MKNPFPERLRGRRGSALLIVLWAVGVMAAAVLGLAEFADRGFSEEASRGKDFHARMLAESGLAIGSHPQIGRHSHLLHQTLVDGNVDVRLASEQARLNINGVLRGGERLDVLLRLFSEWGMKDQEAHRLADVLADWVNPAGPKRLNGAEADDYARMGMPGLPPNRPFPSVEEMEMVPGIEELAKVRPDWKEYFTVFGDGKLDLNEAPAALIEAVCGVGSVAAEEFVSQRDGVGRDSQGVAYTDLAAALAALGLSGADAQAVEGQVTLSSPYRRIVSVGSVGSYRHVAEAVVKLDASPVQYFSWTE